MKKYLALFIPTCLSLLHFLTYAVVRGAGVRDAGMLLNFIVNPILFLVLSLKIVRRWNLRRWIASVIILCSSTGNIALDYHAWRISTGITIGGQAVFFIYEYFWSIGAALLCILIIYFPKGDKLKSSDSDEREGE
jgi:hypothetical protein